MVWRIPDIPNDGISRILVDIFEENTIIFVNNCRNVVKYNGVVFIFMNKYKICPVVVFYTDMTNKKIRQRKKI